jgi:hypothetical protein
MTSPSPKSESLDAQIAAILREHAAIHKRLDRLEAEWEISGLAVTATPRRCPVCGCYQFIYKGDRQVCADCGRE